ncbi:MAG: hypothetical protein ACN6QR_09500, partial [Pseudomonas protegens]
RSVDARKLISEKYSPDSAPKIPCVYKRKTSFRIKKATQSWLRAYPPVNLLQFLYRNEIFLTCATGRHGSIN